VLRPPTIRSLLRALLLVSLVTPRAHAVEWSGNGPNGNWSEPMNWASGIVPTSGSATLQFINAPPTATTTLVQDIANPFLLRTIGFYDIAFTITGDPLQFNSGGIGDRSIEHNSTERQTISTGIILAAATHINGSSSRGITLNGSICGAGSLDDQVTTTLGGASVSLGGSQSYLAPLTLSNTTTDRAPAPGSPADRG
jgi:hypothetical protein